MLQIIIALVLGIMIGIFFKFSDKNKKYLSKYQEIGVVILLFVMGISIGINPNVVNNLSKIGLKALSFAILTTIFSVAFVYLITQLITKKMKIGGSND